MTPQQRDALTEQCRMMLSFLYQATDDADGVVWDITESQCKASLSNMNAVMRVRPSE